MAQHDTYPAAASADASLLELISRYRTVRDAKIGGWRTYCDETQTAAVRNAARVVFLDRTDGYFTLEGEIVETPAQTPEGAVAKALLAIEALDRKRPIPLAGLAFSALADLVPEEAVPGGAVYLRDGSAVAMRDAHKAELEPITDPDADLRKACGVFHLVDLEMARVDDLNGGLTDDATDAVSGAFHEALVMVAGLPARTANGLQAKAAVCRAVLKADEPKATAGQFGGSARRHDVLAWSLLSDMAGVRPLAPVAAAPDPDADLLAVCAEFDAVEHRRNAMFDDDTLTDEANAAIREEQEPLVDRLCEMRATTIKGMQARARSLVLYDDAVMERHTVYTNDRLVAAVLRDLIEEASPMPPSLILSAQTPMPAGDIARPSSLFLLKEGHARLRLRGCISRWVEFWMEAKGGPRLTPPAGGWPEKAVGTLADLRAIVCWVQKEQQQAGVPDVTPTGLTASQHLQVHIESIALSFLSALQHHAASPSLKDEQERVQQAREHARKLRDNLQSLATPGILHKTLHKLGAGIPNEPDCLPSASKTAKALVWTDWRPNYHPLDALIVALDAYKAALDALPRRGRSNLHERSSEDPRRLLGRTCARLLSKRVGPEYMAISDTGLVSKLMLKI